MLISIYALFVFFSSPIMGSLSDKYDKRPILLINLLGSSLGFFIFGVGGALWVLFVGRIIEGITGGIIGTLFAYFSDLVPKKERTKYFGWISAVAGVGSMAGPILGGALTIFGLKTLFFPTLLGVIFCFTALLYTKKLSE